MQLLWADDDNGRLLQPLARILARKGPFITTLVPNFREGYDRLSEAARLGKPIPSAIIDVVLPEGTGRPGLEMNLGLRLADHAIALGTQRIVLLTVVPLASFEKEYATLRGKMKDGHVSYADKTHLLEKGRLDELVRELGGGQRS